MSNLTMEQLQAKILELEKENTVLKNKKTVNGLKVSAKGAVSLYGLGRFPVTLYKNQWFDLLDKSDDIKQFIKDNESQLSEK